MGSSSQLNFIEQVLADHSAELEQETWDDLPAAVKALKPRVELEPEVDKIERTLVFEGAAGEPERLALASLTIFDLEDRYGDLDEEPVW